jgi:peptidyl-prolyl cis-trans isomerase C
MGRRIAAGLVAAVLLVHGDTRADDAGTGAARRAKVVAVIGTGPLARTIAVGELEDRLAAIPAFQRATFGASADAVRHGFLDRVVVRDALLSLDAQAAKVDAEPSVVRAVDRADSMAVVRAIRDHLGPAASVSMDDVRAYYEKNRVRYDAPARYQVWRILCKTREEATEVLVAAQADPTPKAFAALARDHSQDKATALRAGNLGFLTADGVSSDPGLRVDPAVVRAAQGVRDGELVKAPVAEGEFFSVVWRRGTTGPQKRSVEEVASPIREILRRESVKTETDKLLATLRAAKVRDLHEDLLDTADLPAGPDASVTP